MQLKHKDIVVYHLPFAMSTSKENYHMRSYARMGCDLQFRKIGFENVNILQYFIPKAEKVNVLEASTNTENLR